MRSSTANTACALTVKFTAPLSEDNSAQHVISVKVGLASQASALCIWIEKLSRWEMRVGPKIQSLDATTIRNLFGSFDAETEPLEKFKTYFVTNSFYENFTANFPLRIAVGNKGTGKSAVLKAARIESEGREDTITIPLTATDLAARAENLDQNALQAINQWKSIFLTEAATQILVQKGEKWFGKFQGSNSTLGEFISWVRRVIDSKTSGGAGVALRAGVNINAVKKIVFYLDDLDRGWAGNPSQLSFVNSILDACYDMSKKDDKIEFRICMRWDLWDAIAGTNPDIDKIRQNVVFLRWKNHDIYVVVAQRVATFFGKPFDYRKYLSNDGHQSDIEYIFDDILDRQFQGYGAWNDTPMRHVLLAMTRSRPRDLIALLSLAAEEAHKKKRVRINSGDLQAVFPRYSEERLNDLIVEYETRLRGIKNLLLSFKPSTAIGKASDKFRYTNDRITKHLNEAIRLNSATLRMAGQNSAPTFREVLDFLYRIDFLQAWYQSTNGAIERVNFQDRQLVVSSNAEFGYSWEVLPAYRWAIQPTKIQDVIDSLN